MMTDMMTPLTMLELHEIANRIGPDSFRKVALHLSFHYAEIQRFERTNNRNPSQCSGVEDMLMEWHNRGGMRDELCMALRSAGLARLAIEIEKGVFQIDPIALMMHPSRASPPPIKPKPRKVLDTVDLDEVLPNLAQDLTQDQMERLGMALKFKRAAINRFSATNHLTGRVTTRGTLDMLLEWRGRTGLDQQKPELRAALVAIQLQPTADEYLPLAPIEESSPETPEPVAEASKDREEDWRDPFPY